MKKQKKLGARARRAMILEMASKEHENEGTIEIDNNAKISEGDDNGTYVAAWVWVSFDGTELCKGEGGKHGERCSDGCPVWDAMVAAAT